MTAASPLQDPLRPGSGGKTCTYDMALAHGGGLTLASWDTGQVGGGPWCGVS